MTYKRRRFGAGNGISLLRFLVKLNSSTELPG